MVSQSKNLHDLKKKFWLKKWNSKATKELFEKIEEYWIDLSHLRNFQIKETIYNFREHIQTIKKCLQEWKDLSEILHEIWIEETPHSRKMLRKFIKNKDRLMNIKLETTWNTYFQNMKNEQFKKYLSITIDIFCLKISLLFLQYFNMHILNQINKFIFIF